jgi:predicted naringenin-chalcone synthase
MSNQAIKNIIIKNFHRIRPRFEIEQGQLLKWLAKAHLKARSITHSHSELSSMQKFVSRFACDSMRISSRGIDVNDALETDFEKMQIYRISERQPEGFGMLERSDYFSRRCKDLFKEFYSQATKAPSHIIHVTCTGYVSPSGAQVLVAQKDWNRETAVTHAYHMGCYASLPAIRMGQAFASMNLPMQEIDIVHTEMCSLHLNPADHSPEQIVVQSLFADGFIKYSIAEAQPEDRGFEILKIKEFIIPNSENSMSWMTSGFGMQMTLSKDVPGQVVTHLKEFLEDFNLSEDTIFAIHPGGPKIIDAIQDLLKLREDQISHSKNVLFSYGNMSSATLPHIWQDLLDDENIKSGTTVMSLAFGPGLSVFGGLIKKL